MTNRTYTTRSGLTKFDYTPQPKGETRTLVIDGKVHTYIAPDRPMYR